MVISATSNMSSLIHHGWTHINLQYLHNKIIYHKLK
jgi:hypothetical protein